MIENDMIDSIINKLKLIKQNDKNGLYFNILNEIDSKLHIILHEKNYFNMLPFEIVEKIFINLNVKDLLILKTVFKHIKLCKILYEVLNKKIYYVLIIGNRIELYINENCGNCIQYNYHKCRNSSCKYKKINYEYFKENNIKHIYNIIIKIRMSNKQNKINGNNILDYIFNNYRINIYNLLISFQYNNQYNHQVEKILNRVIYKIHLTLLYDKYEKTDKLNINNQRLKYFIINGDLINYLNIVNLKNVEKIEIKYNSEIKNSVTNNFFNNFKKEITVLKIDEELFKKLYNNLKYNNFHISLLYIYIKNYKNIEIKIQKIKNKLDIKKIYLEILCNENDNLFDLIKKIKAHDKYSVQK